MDSKSSANSNDSANSKSRQGSRKESRRGRPPRLPLTQIEATSLEARRRVSPAARLLVCGDEIRRLRDVICALQDAFVSAVHEGSSVGSYGALGRHIDTCLGRLARELEEVREQLAEQRAETDSADAKGAEAENAESEVSGEEDAARS